MNNTLTLLGLLSRSPSYGYDLKHSYDRYFSTQKPMAFGQVYSTLARMIRDELIRALGEETGGGPDRKKYEITLAGKDRVRQWLFTPDVPSETLQSELFAKTVVALLLDDDADRLLDVQRAEHMVRMRELTRLKRDRRSAPGSDVRSRPLPHRGRPALDRSDRRPPDPTEKGAPERMSTIDTSSPSSAPPV